MIDSCSREIRNFKGCVAGLVCVLPRAGRSRARSTLARPNLNEAGRSMSTGNCYSENKLLTANSQPGRSAVLRIWLPVKVPLSSYFLPANT